MRRATNQAEATSTGEEMAVVSSALMAASGEGVVVSDLTARQRCDRKRGGSERLHRW